MIWMSVLACGHRPTEACQQMLDCDTAWAAVDGERDPEWGGDEDPLYGAKGTCWDSSDNEVACDAACAGQLVAYADALTLLADEDEIDAVPAVCPQ